MGLQVWSQVPPSVRAGRTARRLEELGWDGISFPDSQSLAADVTVAATLAAKATSSLRIYTGVTNPVTRHPVVLAGIAASLQELSGGRVGLVVGRGDSALAHLALAPAPTRVLEGAVRIIRALVHGEGVPFANLEDFHIPGLKDVAGLALAHGVESAELTWRDPSVAPAPIEVAASGPRTIAFAARETDGVMLAVGAEPERLRWAVDIARANGATHIGAYLNVVTHHDIDVATRLARSLVAPFARMSVMDGVVRAPVNATAKQQLLALHDAYDMRGHGRSAASHAQSLDPEFVCSFGIVGRPEECVRRIREIAGLGIDRVVIVAPTMASEREEVAATRDLFNAEVLPHLTSRSRGPE